MRTRAPESLMWCGWLPDAPAATLVWAASIERAAAPAMCGNPITHHVAGPGPSTEIRLDARAPRSKPRPCEVMPLQ